MRIPLFLAALAAALAAGAQPTGAGRTQLVLPYDLESRGRVVYVADGLRHQILRLDLATRRLTVVAGTGRAGTAGDGGPARRAQLNEVVALALDRAGNLYAADIASERIRRISPDGRIATVARVPAPGAVDVSPNGRYLAIASLENAVYRLDLRTGTLTRFADGDNPHGLAYEADGDLLVAEQSGLRRHPAGGGRSSFVLRAQIFKVEVAPNRAVYVLSGSPSGGAVDRVVGGRAVRVAGTGGLTPYSPTQPALEAGLLPTDLEVLADGTILLSQSQPVPAIRRLVKGNLVTVLR